MTTRSALWTAAALLAGCATPLPPSAELDAQADAMIQAAFRVQGIATLARLRQDLGQRACSTAAAPGAAVASQIEAEAIASVAWPSGGVYLGDWREGEKLAQNGRGMTWTDTSAALLAACATPCLRPPNSMPRPAR